MKTYIVEHDTDEANALLAACRAALLLYDLPDVDLAGTAQAIRDQLKKTITKAEGQ